MSFRLLHGIEREHLGALMDTLRGLAERLAARSPWLWRPRLAGCLQDHRGSAEHADIIARLGDGLFERAFDPIDVHHHGRVRDPRGDLL